MSTMTRNYAAQSLAYFHTEKGDMTRFVYYDEAIALFPQIKKAKDDAEYYNDVLNLIVRKASEDNLEDSE